MLKSNHSVLKLVNYKGGPEITLGAADITHPLH